MSAQVTITQLPAAGAITGDELVPIVQNGQTVQTTTSAISSSPNQTQTFLTLNQEPTLPNSRALSSGAGVGLVDGGAQAALEVTLNGVAGTLESMSNGVAVNVGGTMTARSIATSGAGLGVTYGDGQSGNPTVALSGIPASLANNGGTGFVALPGNGTVAGRTLTGTASQIDVSNPDGVAGNPTFSIADNAAFPGTESVTVPAGTTAQRPASPSNGDIRYNTDTTRFEVYANSSWATIGTGDGTVSSVTGTANQISVANGTTTPQISITSNPVLPGVQSVKVPAGNNSDRPGSPVNGMIRYNTDLALFEGYVNGAWATFTSGGAGVTSIATGTGLTGGPITSTGTISIDSTVVTLDDVQTLTNKTITSPVVKTNFKFEASGISAYTQFAAAVGSWITNYNGYQEIYALNQNSGSEASMDYVLYNDASDVNSYFLDMGMNSSNYSSATYTVFTPNSGYLFTGGGLSGQASDLFLGTSNAASDVIFFTGDVLAANVRGRFKGDTGNLLLGTATDTGEMLQVNGTTKFSGASSFGSTVLLNQDPTLALQAVTKQYVDNATSAGIHIHEPVLVETTGNLTATYAQGGTTFNITDITGTNTVVTSTTHGLAVNDEIWLTSAGNGLSTNTAYFVYATPTGTSLQLSMSYGGALLTGLTNASGLTYATRANSGVGGTLTNSGVQASLAIDGITSLTTPPLQVGSRVMVRLQTNTAQNGVYVVTDMGSVATNWVLTRATDANKYSPQDTNGLGEGDYFYTQYGTLNAGDSHVLTTSGNIIIGYTGLTYTQFSGAITYTGGTNIDVTGQVISLTGTVAATNGGTGTSTVTTGDLLYGSASNTWSKLPLGIAYKSLIVNASGTQMEWNAIPLNQTTAVSGQLGISNGGTGQSTASAAFNALSPVTTAGDLIIGDGANSSTRLPIGANGYLLTSNGTTASWVAAPASGVTTFSAGATGLTPSTGTTGAVTLGGTLAVASGGTNITNYAAGDLLYASGTTTLSKLTVGATNYVLTSSGTAPQYVAQSTLSVGSATTATTATTATNIAGGAASQLHYQTGVGATGFIANGTAGQVLTSAGSSAPVWSGISGGTF